MESESETGVAQPSLVELRREMGDRAFVNWCLDTSYNADGIERWWQRPRRQLDGFSPRAAWDIPKYRRKIVALAEWLLNSAAT
jgi:hypothetical protein